jgi:hypothetical protein
VKVIAVDNFARDTVDDVLIAEGLDQAQARALADERNAGATMYAARYYRAVPDTYVLQKWEP